ncbi:Uncharacterised protein [Salmonella enterica subsp. enterica serovar Bovismorbificans]|uniref:Uncharacterized protein n=1 Tax=Salmonella enterica subsp. enterica serovar Bovismorbificans TaxID=58097 RepID=A0A655D3J6_SALET|nr:Uncharacterised protein [Salmonella enterica subsp. enterica serovar Bovismorbificans]CPR73396.1 Uncharacterised protein [Salmonella enterica subsp. enterica serovar Bovismorbificans]
MFTAFTIKRGFFFGMPISIPALSRKLFAIFISRFRKEFALFTVLFERSVVFTLVISVVNTTNFTGRIIFRTGADNGAFSV